MLQSPPSANLEANIDGDSRGQVIVGDHNIQIHADHGGKVSVVVPGNRIIPRPRPSPVSILPRPFSGLLDRQEEIGTTISTLDSIQPVEFYGEEGSGKTSLLRHIAHHPDARGLPDGIASISAASLAAGDLSQELFNVFYDLDDHSYKPTGAEFSHLMQDKKALILLDDVELTREELDRVMIALPGCGFITTSRERHLWGEGRSMAVPGLPAQEAIELFERELGRSLADGERASAETLCADLKGNPMLILRAAALAREQRRAITSIPRQRLGIAPTRGLIDEAIAPLNESERQMLGALAALESASVHADHLVALSRLADAQAVLDGLQRRGLVQACESRYSLTTDLSEALQRVWDLTPWRERALAYFSSWIEKNKRAHKGVLQETIAIQNILKWAVKAGRWEEVIKLGRAVEDTLILGGRWDAWEHTLQWMLKAGRALGRIAAVGFALHQLGTRALGLEQKSAAESYLREALNVRESLGDEAGAAVTRNNLDILLGAPPFQEPSQLREAGGLKPQSSARLLKLALIPAALLLIAGLGVWVYFSQSDKTNKNSAGDVEPPPVPQLLLPTIVFCEPGEGQKQTQLEWSAVDDLSGIQSYEIDLTGGSGLQSSTTNTLSVTVTCEQTYGWRVRALDGAGNEGNWSEQSLFQVKALEPDKPGISSFTATPASITIGDRATLRYGIANASSAQIKPSIGKVDVSENSSIEVAPKDTTTYTLIAANTSGQEDQKQVTITVIKPDPVISLSADRKTIVRGESATLSYQVKYATGVSLKPTIRATGTPFEGTAIVTPGRTTTYTLTAIGYSELPHSQQITIEVKGRVDIIMFEANSKTVLEGGQTQLCYTVVNAKGLQIEPAIEEIRSFESDCFTVNPVQTTTYKLTATGYNDQRVDKPFTIEVVPPPKILFFKADPPNIEFGKSVKLSYGVSQARSAGITPRPGKVSVGDNQSVSDSPTQTTTYKLTAVGADGTPVSEEAIVNVGPPPPEIASFTAQPSTLEKPQRVSLCYEVNNARFLRLDSGREFEPDGKCISVTPTTETVYTLTAIGADNSTVSKQVTVKFTSPPKIQRFDASTRDKQTQLCYSVVNAKRVEIDQGEGEQRNPQQGCVSVAPTKTTTYTLTATNNDGSVTKQETVVVLRDVVNPQPPKEDESGWCCIQSRRVGHIPRKLSFVQQLPCTAFESTKGKCIGKGRRFFKTKEEACKVCRSR